MKMPRTNIKLVQLSLEEIQDLMSQIPDTIRKGLSVGQGGNEDASPNWFLCGLLAALRGGRLPTQREARRSPVRKPLEKACWQGTVGSPGIFQTHRGEWLLDCYENEDDVPTGGHFTSVLTSVDILGAALVKKVHGFDSESKVTTFGLFAATSYDWVDFRVAQGAGAQMLGLYELLASIRIAAFPEATQAEVRRFVRLTVK